MAAAMETSNTPAPRATADRGTAATWTAKNATWRQPWRWRAGAPRRPPQCRRGGHRGGGRDGRGHRHGTRGTAGTAAGQMYQKARPTAHRAATRHRLRSHKRQKRCSTVRRTRARAGRQPPLPPQKDGKRRGQGRAAVPSPPTRHPSPPPLRQHCGARPMGVQIGRDVASAKIAGCKEAPSGPSHRLWPTTADGIGAGGEWRWQRPSCARARAWVAKRTCAQQIGIGRALLSGRQTPGMTKPSCMNSKGLGCFLTHVLSRGK